MLFERKIPAIFTTLKVIKAIKNSIVHLPLAQILVRKERRRIFIQVIKVHQRHAKVRPIKCYHYY
jgi:hypothetical protein